MLDFLRAKKPQPSGVQVTEPNTARLFINDTERTLFGLPNDNYIPHAQEILSGNKWLSDIVSELEDAPVILDVGANIGLTVLIEKTIRPNARVIAFEPEKDAFECLEKTVRMNGLTGVETIRSFVGKSGGQKLAFVRGDASSAHSYLTSASGGESIDLVSVDRIVADRKLDRVDFIKIDVEGSEMRVLDSARETISRFHPKILFEFNVFHVGAHGHMNPVDFIERCQEFGRLFRRDHDSGDLIEIRSRGDVESAYLEAILRTNEDYLMLPE